MNKPLNPVITDDLARLLTSPTDPPAPAPASATPPKRGDIGPTYRKLLWELIKASGSEGLNSRQLKLMVDEHVRSSVSNMLHDMRKREMVYARKIHDPVVARVLKTYFTDDTKFVDKPLPRSAKSAKQVTNVTRRLGKLSPAAWPTAPVQAAPAPAPAPVQEEQTPKLNGTPHHHALAGFDPDKMTVGELLAAMQQFDDLKAKLKGLLG
jgi:hypothetical protein